jgi:DNA sulfur modification protein DndC
MSTPACGGSRFGCWVCTVVKDDKSMKGLIERGDDWMNPLLELRNFLATTINRSDPKYDPLKYRMPVRRTFQDGLGPYWPQWRNYILEEILKAQLLLQRHDSSLQLITLQELVAIQLIWQRDFIFDINVADTYQSVYGEKIQLSKSDQAIQEEKHLLREICGTNKDDFEIINHLLKAEKNRILFTNKKGLQRDLESVLAEYVAPTFTDVYKKNSNK